MQIVDTDRKWVADLLLVCNSGFLSVRDALSFVGRNFARRPLLTLYGYSILLVETLGFVDKGRMYEAEVPAIAYRTFNVNPQLPNMFSVPRDFRSALAPYFENTRPPRLARLPYEVLGGRPGRYLSGVTILLGSLVWLPMLVFTTSWKRHTESDTARFETSVFVFVASLSAFLHIAMHAVLGASIDRYASPAILVALMAIVAMPKLIGRRGGISGHSDP